MILIAAGSNLSTCGVEPQPIVNAAIFSLGAVSTVSLRSSNYVSQAWPDRSNPNYINAVAAIETSMSPQTLMSVLQTIEYAFNRKRSLKNASRTLDLDIIAYHEVVTASDAPLALPHPRLAERSFVLAPIDEIAPQWCHPETGLTAAQMLSTADIGGLRRI